MKTNFYKQKIRLTLISAVFSMNAIAQTTISDFENLSLSPNSYNDGSTGSGAFTSGNASFQNTYNASWFYWDSGFAYSNQGDTTLAPSDYMTQMYQTKAGMANDGSANFAIGQQGAKVNLVSAALGSVVNGVYITNTTYAFNSMKLGDAFGKKFGDTLNSPHSADSIHGSYPDWFKPSITGYRSGSIITDTVHFYLADYRFSNDSLDYIVKDWTWVDLTPLGNIDSLLFNLSSSDVGAFGMNTPAYFCVDDLETVDLSIGIAAKETAPAFSAYPNPFENELSVRFEVPADRKIDVYNALGALTGSIRSTGLNAGFDFTAYPSGVYFLKVTEGKNVSSMKVIKK